MIFLLIVRRIFNVTKKIEKEKKIFKTRKIRNNESVKLSIPKKK